ncbi:MAG: hypothetical protein CTY16_06025 [Methylobacter sp.]|nr:MAG: hypothetical protein CTY16_06025 [Methylobacter sp.]
MMYAVIAEDTNDFACLKVLIRRLANDKSIVIKGKGYMGCGEMLNKGKRDLQNYAKQGCTKFIICYDKDRESKQKRYEDVITKIIKPANLKKAHNLICILIPTEEIEAWILADIKAIAKIIPTWQPTQEFHQPETVISPKEHLTRLSRDHRSKPLYIYTLHNEKVLEHVDLDIVKKKCPSFIDLAVFVEENKTNYPEK